MITEKLLLILETLTILYITQKNIFEHPWGPLVYIHPENDHKLRTWNVVGELDENMRLKWHTHIDTSKHPDKELWEFVGLEDVRIFRWEENFGPVVFVVI